MSSLIWTDPAVLYTRLANFWMPGVAGAAPAAGAADSEEAGAASVRAVSARMAEIRKDLAGAIRVSPPEPTTVRACYRRDRRGRKRNRVSRGSRDPRQTWGRAGVLNGTWHRYGCWLRCP